VENRKSMTRGRKVWLGVLAVIVTLVAAFFLWASWKSNQTIAELKSIADRLQTSPGWEPLRTQKPASAAVCIPLDGPCSQYSYRWATHEAYGEGDLEKYIQQVRLVPQELEKCERNQRFNAGGLSCHAVGVIDGWDVRITVHDYGPDDDNATVQIVVNHYGY
jgi:hypothetical protein